LPPSDDLARVDGVKGLARRIDTGFLATLEQTDIGKLTDEERERVKAKTYRRIALDA